MGACDSKSRNCENGGGGDAKEKSAEEEAITFSRSSALRYPAAAAAAAAVISSSSSSHPPLPSSSDRQTFTQSIMRDIYARSAIVYLLEFDRRMAIQFGSYHHGYALIRLDASTISDDVDLSEGGKYTYLSLVLLNMNAWMKSRGREKANIIAMRSKCQRILQGMIDNVRMYSSSPASSGCNAHWRQDHGTVLHLMTSMQTESDPDTMATFDALLVELAQLLLQQPHVAFRPMIDAVNASDATALQLCVRSGTHVLEALPMIKLLRSHAAAMNRQALSDNHRLWSYWFNSLCYDSIELLIRLFLSATDDDTMKDEILTQLDLTKTYVSASYPSGVTPSVHGEAHARYGQSRTIVRIYCEIIDSHVAMRTALMAASSSSDPVVKTTIAQFRSHLTSLLVSLPSRLYSLRLIKRLRVFYRKHDSELREIDYNDPREILKLQADSVKMTKLESIVEEIRERLIHQHLLSTSVSSSSSSSSSSISFSPSLPSFPSSHYHVNFGECDDTGRALYLDLLRLPPSLLLRFGIDSASSSAFLTCLSQIDIKIMSHRFYSHPPIQLLIRLRHHPISNNVNNDFIFAIYSILIRLTPGSGIEDWSGLYQDLIEWMEPIHVDLKQSKQSESSPLASSSLPAPSSSSSHYLQPISGASICILLSLFAGHGYMSSENCVFDFYSILMQRASPAALDHWLTTQPDTTETIWPTGRLKEISKRIVIFRTSHRESHKMRLEKEIDYWTNVRWPRTKEEVSVHLISDLASIVLEYLQPSTDTPSLLAMFGSTKQA